MRQQNVVIEENALQRQAVGRSLDTAPGTCGRRFTQVAYVDATKAIGEGKEKNETDRG